MNISSLNNRFLEQQNALALHQQSAHKTDQLQKAEEQIKEMLKKKPTEKVGSKTSINPEAIKVSVQGEMAHFEFMKDMEGLSSDEKRHISRLIQQSVKKPNGGTGDYFIMDRAQTTAQLQLIADKLIPEKYKEQMNEAIKNYQEEGYNFQVKIYEAAQTSMDELSAKYPSVGKKTILTDGMKRLQEQETFAYGLYSGLDFSSQSTFVQSFETILTQFKENQLQLKNSPEDVLSQYQDELRVKWNDYASLLNASEVYKLSTAGNSIFDVRL